MQQLPAPDLNRLVAYFSHEYKPEETNKPPSKAYVQPFRVFTDYYREIYQSPLAKRDQVGPVWSTLSADQRKPFQDAAHVAKELYAKNLKAWENYCAKHGIQNKNRQGITTNQVKRLTQSIPNGKMCDPSALHAIARATELFIQRYAKDSFEYSDSQQSRKLSASDAYSVLESSPRYDFLRVVLPDPDGESPQVSSPTVTTVASSANSTPTPTTTPNPLPPTPTTPTPQQMAAYQQRIAYYAHAAQAQAAAQAAQMNRSHPLPSASPMTKRRASSMPGSQSSMVRQSPRAVSASAVDGNRVGGVTTTKRKFNEMDGGDQPHESRRKRQRMDDGKIQSSTNGDASSMRFGHPQSLQGLGSTPSTMPPLRSSPYHSNDDVPSVRSASPSSEQQNDGGGGRHQEDSKLSDTSHHSTSTGTNGVTPQLKLNRSPGSQNGKFALQSAVQVPVQSTKGTELKGMNALQSRQLLDYQAAYQQQQYMMAMNTYGYAGMDVMGFNSLGMITPQQQAYLSALAQHANPGTGVPQSTNETSDSQEWVKFMN